MIRALVIVTGAALALQACLPACAGVLGVSAPVNPQAPSIAPVSDARKLYVLHCAGCHGQDGVGSGRSGVPDLHRMGALLRVPGGREFLIQVPGVMGSGLDDAQVALVGNWMLDRFLPEDERQAAQPYTRGDVQWARAHPLADVMQARRHLLEQSPREEAR